jgi:hypothetical protein
VVESARSDKAFWDDLPPYLAETPAAQRSWQGWRDALSRLRQRDSIAPHTTGASPVAFSGLTPRLSPTFSRMVELHRDRLPSALDAWWAAGQKAGSLQVYRRLQLKPPEGDARGGWRMRGRIRRLIALHSIPVVVELWPRYDDFTIMTMTPQRPVLATRRYFRIGHAVLDRLWAELAAQETPSPSARSLRRP